MSVDTDYNILSLAWTDNATGTNASEHGPSGWGRGADGSQRPGGVDAGVPLKFISTMTATQNVIVGSSLLAIGVLGLTVNGLFLALSFKSKAPLKPVEYYMRHLSILYVIVIIVAYPQPVASCFLMYWPFYDAGCWLYGFFVYFTGLIGMGTLTVMSAVIYVKTCSARYRSKINNKLLRNTMIVLYIKAGLWTACPFMGWGRYGPEVPGFHCGLDWSRMSRSYTATMAALWLVAPMFVMTYSYCRIIIKLKSSSYYATTGSRNSPNQTLSTQMQKISRVSKISFCLCSGFMMAWAPYMVMSFWKAFGNNTYPIPIVLQVLPALTAKSTVIHNPLIYMLLNTNFRAKLKGIFCHSGAVENVQGIADQMNPQPCEQDAIILSGSEIHSRQSVDIPMAKTTKDISLSTPSTPEYEAENRSNINENDIIEQEVWI